MTESKDVVLLDARRKMLSLRVGEWREDIVETCVLMEADCDNFVCPNRLLRTFDSLCTIVAAIHRSHSISTYHDVHVAYIAASCVSAGDRPL